MVATIKIHRGDTRNLDFNFTDSTGAIIDITGYTVFLTVKAVIDNDLTDNSAIIKKTVTSHTDPTNGVTVVSLTSTDTNQTPGSYLYDIQLKSPAGDISTGAEYPAKFIILSDVTRRTV